ncbi:hypothetical protein F7725_011549 [Dissostichus mawsoni]|uniref:Uncharacterized protein n=1 Tax=Dissostichus mawsoni TaxID=36200 RepID=A0A7J5ZDD8_DISMA|nr:hypothetical protein F7725_011549 [Dissostichus mawsoni]
MFNGNFQGQRVAFGALLGPVGNVGPFNVDITLTYKVYTTPAHTTLAQVFSLLQSKESITSASLVIIYHLNQWGCA